MAASTEERLARIEAVYEHLATKADLERLRSDMESKMNALTWKVVGVQILGIGIMIGVMRLMG